jgi:Tol biopolymer transport system component
MLYLLKMLVISSLILVNAASSSASTKYRFLYSVRQLDNIAEKFQNSVVAFSSEQPTTKTIFSIESPKLSSAITLGRQDAFSDLLPGGIIQIEGDWARIRFSQGQSPYGGIGILNLRSGENRLIDEGMNVRSGDALLSPNGKFLVYGKVENTLNTYLYNIQQKTTTALVRGTSNQRHHAWTYDSKRLAVSTSYCIKENCLFNLSVYDVESGQRQQFIDISPLVTEESDWAALCQMQWSPDDRYISFVTNCYPEETFQDVFVWEVNKPYIQQATQVATKTRMKPGTTVLPKGEYTGIMGIHWTAWQDARTLIVGTYAAPYVVGDNKETYSQTIYYDVPTDTPHKWLDYQAARFAVGTQGRVAYQIQEGFDTILPTIEIAQYDSAGQKYTKLATNIKGCDPIWSPDGNTLAYTERKTDPSYPNTTCYGKVERFVFRNMSDGKTTTYEIGTEYPLKTDNIEPIGWLEITE